MKNVNVICLVTSEIIYKNRMSLKRRLVYKTIYFTFVTRLFTFHFFDKHLQCLSFLLNAVRGVFTLFQFKRQNKFKSFFCLSCHFLSLESPQAFFITDFFSQNKTLHNEKRCKSSFEDSELCQKQLQLPFSLPS